MAKTDSTRRKSKPVIEKKRRERINRNLDALRALLLRNTADTRLENPKMEKAEILDLAVQYIRKNTCNKTKKKVSIQLDLEGIQTHLKAPKPIWPTHIHQSVSDFTSCMSQKYLSERETVHHRVEKHMNSNSPRAADGTNIKKATSQTIVFQSASLNPSNHNSSPPEPSSASCKSGCPNLVLLTPSASPNHLSPPHSPRISPSFLPFSISPLSVPYHRPFAPSVSPQLLRSLCTSFSGRSSTSPLHLLSSHTSKDLPSPPSWSLDIRAHQFLIPAMSTWRPWS